MLYAYAYLYIGRRIKNKSPVAEPKTAVDPQTLVGPRDWSSAPLAAQSASDGCFGCGTKDGGGTKTALYQRATLDNNLNTFL